MSINIIQNYQFHDFVGTAGVTLTLIAYFLLHAGKWESHELKFSFANAFGSGMILYSLAHDFNFSGFLIESIWVVISLYGASRTFFARKNA